MATGATALALMIGVSLGLLAGYLGGWVDGVVNRMTETAMAFPNLLLAVGIAVVVGPGLLNVVIIIACSPGTTRLGSSAVHDGDQGDDIRGGGTDVGARPRRILWSICCLRSGDRSLSTRLDHREQHHLRGQPVLSRRRRPAADGELGTDAV